MDLRGARDMQVVAGEEREAIGETREAAELELQRYHDDLLTSDVTEATGAALKYAAAVLRLKAVRWSVVSRLLTVSFRMPFTR